MGNTWASVKRKDEAGPQQTAALPGCVGAAGPPASPGGHPGRLPSSISTSAAFPLQGEAGPQGDQGREGPVGVPGDPVGSPAAGGQGGSCCQFGSAHRFRGRSLFSSDLGCFLQGHGLETLGCLGSGGGPGWLVQIRGALSQGGRLPGRSPECAEPHAAPSSALRVRRGALARLVLGEGSGLGGRAGACRGRAGSSRGMLESGDPGDPLAWRSGVTGDSAQTEAPHVGDRVCEPLSVFGAQR